MSTSPLTIAQFKEASQKALTKTQLKELKTETYDALVALETAVRSFDLAFLGGVCPDDGPPPKPSLEEFQRLVWTMKDAVTTLDQATLPR